MKEYFLIIAFFCFINFLIILFSNKLILFFNLYDHPNSIRKFHKNKTSLLGGSIILINILFFYLIDIIFNFYSFNNFNLTQLIFGAIFFYSLGLMDDKYDINANLKFILEILISILIINFDEDIMIKKIYFSIFDYSINLGNYSYLFTVFCIVIFVNALNMYDGVNLQSGSYTLILIISLYSYFENPLLLIILAISLLSFLFLNFKSKIFLGDNGAYLLGFIISYIVIKSAQNLDYLYLTADKILLLMIIPGLELIRLFLLRLIKKKHPFSADRDHIHHILLKNFSQNKTILILILLSLFPAITIIIAYQKIYIMLLVYIIVYFWIIKKYG